MAEVLLVGLSISAVIGFLHAVYVYRLEMAEAETGRGVHSIGRAVYSALWAFFLWLLLGSYVLLFWLASIVVYALHRAARFMAHAGVGRRGTAAGH